jgi:hypothetical protein
MPRSRLVKWRKNAGNRSPCEEVRLLIWLPLMRAESRHNLSRLCPPGVSRRTLFARGFYGHFHKWDANCRRLAGCRDVLRRLRSRRSALPERRPREWQRTVTGRLWNGQYRHWRARKRNRGPTRARHPIRPRNRPSVAGPTSGQTTWAEWEFYRHGPRFFFVGRGSPVLTC